MTHNKPHRRDSLGRKSPGRGCLCWGEKHQRSRQKTGFIYVCFLGAELSRVEISMVKIGEISSPELGGVEGLVGFPVQTFHLKLAYYGEDPTEDLCNSYKAGTSL